MRVSETRNQDVDQRSLSFDVGIPTFNRPELLRGAISSVLSQSHHDLLVTVVDNGSAAETAAVLQQFDDPRVRVRRNPHTIPRTENYNIALCAGTGDFVAILADDDEWMPNFLARTAQVLNDHPDVSMVHTGYEAIDVTGERLYVVEQPLPDAHLIVSGTDYIQRMLGGEHRIEFTATMLRRQSLPPGGFLAEDDVGDDIGLLLRVAIQGDVAFVNEPLVRVRFHDNTISTTGGNRLVGDRYVRSVGYRIKCTETKVRFIEENAHNLPHHRRLRRIAKRSLRRHLLVSAARALRPPRDVRGALRSAVTDTALDRRALVDPRAWKQALAAYLDRA